MSTTTTTTTTTITRAALVATGLLTASLALAGCAQPAPAPEPAPTSAAPSTPEPAPSTDPLAGLTCADLVSDAILSSVGTNVTEDASFTPTSGSYPAQIAAIGGLACGWTGDGGASLVIAVGVPDATTLESTKAEISRAGDESDALGTDAPAWLVGTTPGSGDLEIFTSLGTWVSIVSTSFTDAAGARPIAAQVLQALPS